MNISYGDAVGDMIITLELDPHPCTLEVGNQKHMKFNNGETYPFWLSEVELLRLKMDKLNGDNKKRRYKTKMELLLKLRKAGEDTTKHRYLKQSLLRSAPLIIYPHLWAKIILHQDG